MANGSFQVFQTPHPGTRMLRFRGDTVNFVIELSEPVDGTAWIRTNIGHASTTRSEIIESVEADIPPLGKDWFDIAMKKETATRFSATLPLTEVGHFEAKCFFIASGENVPVWPQGPNTEINVSPADTCCANIIYNAFVRQFGPNIDGSGLPDEMDAACVERLDKKGYTVIPMSGTFRDLIRRLDFITGELGCRFLHLLPIHPTPTTYGRMGRFGSPYAALSFTGIDPALAVFDPKATPLEQFIELVDAVHMRNAKLILDIAINHTGWASTLHETHPEWLKRDPEGKIEVPGAWGVTWSDLTSLDYSKKDLWRYIANIFLTWCRRGVDGFRCDAGYMIPAPVWKYIIAAVRDQYPDTVFFLEGLGGKIEVTRELLNRAGFDWAYSELFQNYDRGQIEHYLPESIDISEKDGLTVHFAETHDNNRLASRSTAWARMRTALCALLSHNGGFGFANGVEWFATVKIDVHDASPLNWGNPDNQVAEIRRLNILLRNHPAFFSGASMEFLTEGPGNHLVVMRRHVPTGKALLIAANLEDTKPTACAWKVQQEFQATAPIDLLTGRSITVETRGSLSYCELSPGEVLCLTADPDDLELFDQPDDLSFLPERIILQRFRAKALDIFSRLNGTCDISDLDMEDLVRSLANDPAAFCLSLNQGPPENNVTRWRWPVDTRREVMVPPGHFLLVSAPVHFCATIEEQRGPSVQKTVGREESLPASDGGFFALFAPPPESEKSVRRILKMVVHESEGSVHARASLLFLGQTSDPQVRTVIGRGELADGERIFLATNGRGGMCRANIWWGKLLSRYDALLAANLNPDLPEDRRVLFTRCRAWIVFQGYSREICFDCLDTFGYRGNKGVWRYKVPVGQGQSIDLVVTVTMSQGENRVDIVFKRLRGDGLPDKLDDGSRVRLILRPDIEDRSFHETTKAYNGPEQSWPDAIRPLEEGFEFAPASGRRLTVTVGGGVFVSQPEWYYMVYRPLDAERNMDPHSDLFSPGYIEAEMEGGQAIILTARADFRENAAPAVQAESEAGLPACVSAKELLRENLAAYLVHRGSLLSVIAGYPWFLDWGRDSMIFARGLIACGMLEEAMAILKQFGRLEKNGTLPNMICGDSEGNRDTSDAPLWFIVACLDMAKHDVKMRFLSEPCGERPLSEVIKSIGVSYLHGTTNGIKMDAESGLIFSPAHFTWMDTNFPACTPRQGYCIEIQALWYAALRLLSRIEPHGHYKWEELSQRVKESVYMLFPLHGGYLADCLIAKPGEPAKNAHQDDALRPNQLLAVTLGAVTDRRFVASILDACQTLLVPGAIRSLADAPVETPLEIRHNGELLGDPYNPYHGRYTGDEDTGRKPAYHNGTAWTWLFPSFCEAWAALYGERGRKTARSLMTSSLELLGKGCLGHLPEILDGDYPHTQRGCDAQAWGISEWMRIWTMLEKPLERDPLLAV